jgi:hypothetical protein
MLDFYSFVLVYSLRMALRCQDTLQFDTCHELCLYHLYFIVFYWVSLLLDTENVRTCTLWVTWGSSSVIQTVPYILWKTKFNCCFHNKTPLFPVLNQMHPLHIHHVSQWQVWLPHMYLHLPACLFLDEVLWAVSNTVSILSCSSTFLVHRPNIISTHSFLYMRF